MVVVHSHSIAREGATSCRGEYVALFQNKDRLHGVTIDIARRHSSLNFSRTSRTSNSDLKRRLDVVPPHEPIQGGDEGPPDICGAGNGPAPSLAHSTEQAEGFDTQICPHRLDNVEGEGNMQATRKLLA